ncbi:MAG: MG2 domain-containing protein [Acidobacteriota bacterium]
MNSRAPIVLLAAILLVPTLGAAQPQGNSQSPAFSVWSSQIYTTGERASFDLTFRRIDHLDFRVYRVEDPLAFFSNLDDPHRLGSEKPMVPQEQTLIERIALWKSARRLDVRDFLRRQVSYDYRRLRREQADKSEVALRQTLRYNTFAQVPLLNPSRLVASWREVLPPVRDPESRRIPLDVKDPGVYVIEAVNAPLKAYTIVMISDIGLVTKTSPGQILVFAAHRRTGKPQQGCDVQTFIDRKPLQAGRTGDDGIAVWDINVVRPDTVVTVARCGTQVTASDPGGWSLQEETRTLVGYVYTDKPIYRPGHTVNTKAVLRWRSRALLSTFDAREAEISIADSNDKVVFRQTVRPDEFGSVHASYALPTGAALGYYTITVASGDLRANGSFEVQEYRKPEFEVTVTSPDRFVVQGGTARATITARYYFGQPVSGGAVTYVVHRQPYYSPLRWIDDAEEDSGWWGGEQTSEATTRLGADGAATISVPVPVSEERRDYSLRIEARVTDASNREVSGSTMVHGTYGKFFVTSSTDRYVYRAGAPLQVSAKALDYTGNAQAGVGLSLRLERLTYPDGRWSDPRITPVAQGTIQTDQDGLASWSSTIPRDSGSYRVVVAAQSDGRTVEDTSDLWVAGERAEAWDEGDVFLELIADRKTYLPGDTARLVIRGGQVSAPVLVTKEAQYISYHRVAQVGADATVEVPIDESDLGDTYVNVVFLKDDRLYRAERRVKVPATSRQLSIAVEADPEVGKPGGTGRFSLSVTDADGAPVKAQLSVGIVDEAVYGVKPDSTPDPVRFFYRLSYSRVWTDFSRDYSFVGYAGSQELLLTHRRRPFTLADFKGDTPQRPQVRKEFPDAIFWVADLVTAADGRAEVEVPYPDALTTWRLTARAVTADTRAGTGVARTMTTKDLILRIATPRFLTEGDRVDLPFIVHNFLPGDATVTLTGAATGLAPEAEQPAGGLGAPRELQIAQNGEARVDWRLEANEVGQAVVRGTAVTPDNGDALELSLPVRPFGLKREAGAAGSMVGAGVQTAELQVPATSNPSARSIRVQVAPTLAGPLLGALDFLSSYPYGCTEQTLSSFVPNILVQRALADLQLPPTEQLRNLDRRVTEGLTRLYDYQHQDGGWGWWKTDENHPFMTAYAVAGLLEARQAGFKVDEWRIGQGVRALRKLYAEYPRAIPDLKTYTTWVILLATARGIEAEDWGDPPSWERNAALNELWSARGRMSPYGRGLLLMALDLVKDPRGDDLARELLGAVERKGDLAWWTTIGDPLLEDFADTSVEATATIVRALAPREPTSPVLEQAVRWLLLNRTFGTYWASTKQTSMVLAGLIDYMRARGEKGAEVDVEVFVNGGAVGSRRLTGADLSAPDPIEFMAPAVAGANTVRVVTKGVGTIYWGAQAGYYDTAGAQERTGSHRLALERQYFSLTPATVNNRIVYRESPFTGSVKPGDLLLVRLTAAGSTDWRYLMLEDPIPAGTEPVQQDGLYQLERRRGDWWGSQREYRDDRVVFFQQSFSQGRYEYTYLLRAVTPGVFRASPARISAMYVPDGTASSAAQAVAVVSAAGGAAVQPGGGRQ